MVTASEPTALIAVPSTLNSVRRAASGNPADSAAASVSPDATGASAGATDREAASIAAQNRAVTISSCMRPTVFGVRQRRKRGLP